MSVLLTALCALTTPIDPKVRLVVQKPQPGSNAWDQVVFNDYCYEKTGDTTKTETRTRAMASLFGKAAELLAKDDPTGTMSVRTFYKNAKGENTPRLHITIRPTTTASAPQMDAGADLASLTEQLAELDFDFSTVPANISGNTAAYVGYLRAALAKRASQAVQTEVTQASETPAQSEAPPL